MDVLINLTVVIISQCIHISNHHVVHHFKYIAIFLINYTLIKLGGKRKKERKGGRAATTTLLKFLKVLSFN